LIYLVLNFLVVRAVAWLEYRLSPHLRERPADAIKKVSPSLPTHS
jgi:octopine/nopaline transport system permease protein